MERIIEHVYQATFVSLKPGYEVGLDAEPFVALIKVENRTDWFPVKNPSLFKPGEKVIVTEVRHPAEQQAKPYIEHKISSTS